MKNVLRAFLFLAVSTAAIAQNPPAGSMQSGGPILTLEEAVQLALRNSPTHLRNVSARSRAGTAVRSAYGAWLPQVGSSFSTSFREGGSEIVAGQQFGASNDILNSSYSIGISASFSGRSLMQPRVARAGLDAAEADVTASAAQLRSDVMTQYLNVLQAQAQAALADTLLANAQAQLELNRAREQVGAGTSLQVRQAEVQVGQQRVNVLRQRNAVENQLMLLFQFMGVQRMDGVRLTTTFSVTEPALALDELLGMARRANPALNALRARESAANVQVAQARSQWLPSINFQTGFQGNAYQQTNIEPSIASARLQADAARGRCLSDDSVRVGAGLSARGGCDLIQFTDADADAMRAANQKFPFSFTKSPFGYGVTFSLNLFNGFQREQQIQDAAAFRNEARYSVRAQELQMQTSITSAYRNLITQYQTVQLQEQNRATALQALELAQERYRVGASNFIEVTQARDAFERASNDHINAIYDYHKFYAALELAVGRPLR
ncbi:MAG: TolC family protein [Gemmatimonadaceae bacterium]|nr:TolC family protein [Gemmatimonadaceae bacterium]